MTVENVRDIVVALEQHGRDMELAVSLEMARLAQETVRTMQRLVPKSRNDLRSSVVETQTGELEYEITATSPHAWYVDKGVKPGGKGLPRFFDPASADIVAWLRGHPAGGKPARKRTPKFASRAFQAAELALRDRYQGLYSHIRQKGVKAQPFVEPTAVVMEPIVLMRLNLAVRRVLAARPDGGAA